MKLDLSTCKNVLIVGAGHGIGYSLVENLLSFYPQLNVYATYRIEKSAGTLFRLKDFFMDRLFIHQVDPTNDSQVFDLSIDLKSKNITLDLIINSVGLLHNEKISPEKSIKSFNPDSYLEIVKVNSVVTPIIAKHFEKLVNKDNVSAFISISAKVGSIEDNRMGGWYSYRASKAALNMLIKGISIEFNRKRMNCIVMAIHPGTTNTTLSSPYIKNTTCKVHSSEETAANIIKTINHKNVEDSGKFYSWNNEELPW